MQFQTGQIVTHPHHGPVSVTGFFDRTFKGQQVTYLELTVRLKELTLQVPMHKAEEIGLRPLMSLDEFSEVMATLKEQTEVNNDTWAHRIKEYQQQLHDGGNLGRAVVIREILRKHGGQPMPGTEKQLYLDALDFLSEEASLALDEPKDAVRTRIIEAVDTSALVA